MSDTDRIAALRRSYDVVAAEYGRRIVGELAGKPLDRELLEAVARDAVGPVVDLGCGPGHVAAFLAAHGADVVGVDLSQGMLAEARARYPELRFVHGDLRDPPGGPWGGAVLFYSLIHVPPSGHAPALWALRLRMRRDAPVLVAAHVGEGCQTMSEWWGHPVDADFHYVDPDDLITAMSEAGFVDVRVWERDPYPDVEAPTRRVYVRGLG